MKPRDRLRKAPDVPKPLITTVRALRAEGGFTLPELLTVIIIVGALAAIALPTFLREADKASDADAKSNAGFLVGHVEACNTEAEDFTKCDEAGELKITDVVLGSAPGQVSVTAAGEKAYTVVAVSEVESDGTPHRYTVSRDLSGTPVTRRECGVAGRGGCGSDGEW